MMIKIVPDTCVLISAVINKSAEKLGVNVPKHKFYEISRPLVDYLTKNVDKREGIVTTTIETETKTTFNKAIMSLINDNEELKPEEKKGLFDSVDFIEKACQDTLQDLLDYTLVKEPYNKERLDKEYLPKIVDFFNKIPDIKKQKNEEFKSRMGYVSKYYKKTIQPIFQRELDQKYKQLDIYRMKKENRERDIRILSECCYIRDVYKIHDPSISFYLVSTDVGFVTAEPSEVITKSIEEEFKIKCRWPDKLLKEINAWHKK